MVDPLFKCLCLVVIVKLQIILILEAEKENEALAKPMKYYLGKEGTEGLKMQHLSPVERR